MANPAEALARNLYWQLKLNDRQQPVAWWAELGDYYVEIEYPGGGTLPRSWEVRYATDELVSCGTANSLADAKTAVAGALIEVGR